MHKLYNNTADFGIEDVMDAYNSIPKFTRGFAGTLVIGGTKDDFAGGSYNSLRERVSINSKSFSDKGVHHHESDIYAILSQVTTVLIE